jgi:hypothetical protein
MAGRTMKASLKALCVICIIMAVGPRAAAFWSASLGSFINKNAINTKIHQTITSDALGAVVYDLKDPSGQKYSFTAQSIDAINESHARADSDPYIPARHFDRESLIDGYNLLVTTRRNLIAMLAAGYTNAANAQNAAQNALGYMLHQVQDFYSHSTWDARHPVTAGSAPPILDFGAATVAGASMPSSFLPDLPEDQIGTVCDSDAITLTTNTNVTTGYYDATTITVGTVSVPIYSKSAPSGKCEHGSLMYAVIAGCADLVAAAGAVPQPGMIGILQGSTSAQFVPDGISRDHPCFQTAQNIGEYLDAKERALRETQAFVQSILTELVSAGNSEGACTLMGLDPNSTVCAGTCASQATQGGSASLNFTLQGYTNLSTAPGGGYANGVEGLQIFATNQYCPGAYCMVAPSVTAILEIPAVPATGTYEATGGDYYESPPGSALSFTLIPTTGDSEFYGISSPNQVQVQSISPICTDSATKTEFDVIQGTVSFGLVNLSTSTGPYTTGSITGSFSGYVYQCQRGHTPLSQTVQAVYLRCQ